MISAASRIVGAAAVIAVAVTGCGSSDSTHANTPAPAATEVTAAPPTVAAPASQAPAPADPCAVDLTAPAITAAISELPPDPRSGQGWSAEPIAGNYNECAQLSAVIIRANTNAENPNTRALMFHQGTFIPEGVPDTFGFNGIDTTVSAGDTVGLKYSGGVSGLDSVVRFRWSGDGVELIGNTG